MTASVYTLRIRETPDDEAGSEVRIVASSLTEAVARAELRFGPGRIAGIEQEEPVPLDATADPEAVNAAVETAEAAVAQAEGHDISLATAPSSRPHLTVLETEAAGPSWLPSALLWGGIGVGLLGFVLWLNFGSPGHERFVTAKSEPAPKPSGLALGGDAPPGGVLDAVGVDLRGGAVARDEFGELVQQGVAVIEPSDGSGSGVGYGDEDVDDDAIDPATVRSIGTLVGELFSREPEPPPPPREPSADNYAGDAYAEQAATAPLPPAPELRRWYIEVQRADRVTETLAVQAYDADHARRVVSDRPDHPVIIRGPALDLTW